MGFLSGVLTNIQGHLGQHKDTLDIAIKLLETNKHAGKKGFNEAFGSVVAGVGGYNKAVEQSNNKVSEPITLILSQVNEEFKSSVAGILTDEQRESLTVSQAKQAVQNIDEKLKLCQGYAEAFNNAFNLEQNKYMKTDVNDLNPKLRDSVLVALNAAQHESKRLQKLSEKAGQDLRSVYFKSITTLNKLQKNVKKKIKQDVERLVHKLNELVTYIKSKLSEVDALLKKYVIQLSQWIEKTKALIDAAKQNVENILTEADWTKSVSSSGNWQAAVAAAGELRQQAQALLEAGEAAKQKVQSEVTEALKQVLVLDRAVKIGLKHTKDVIKGALQKYVKNQLLGDVKGQVLQITNYQTGIEKIEDAVRKLAAGFNTSEGFEKKVKEWVAHIVNDNDFVIEKVKDYVAKNTQLEHKYKDGTVTPIDEDLTEVIANQIVAKLRSEGVFEGFPEAVRQMIQEASASASKIKEHVVAISFGCQQFADGLEGILTSKQTSKGILKLAGEIAGEIENALTKKNTINANLQTAVRYTLLELVGRARQTAADLGWLIGEGQKDGNIGTVDASLDVAKKLHEKLRQATTDSRTPVLAIPPTVSALTDSIYNYDARILGILESEIGKDSDDVSNGNQIANVNDDSFMDYDIQITQNTLTSAVDNPYTVGGQLPQKIKSIKTQVTDVALSEITRFNDDAGAKLSGVIDTLDKLCNSIFESASYVNTHCINMKKEYIDDALQNLRKRISDLRSYDLNFAIQQTTEFVEAYAPQLRKECIDSLASFVDSEVQNAISTLTTLARINYVTSIKDLLTSFAEKINEELQSLPKKIAEDLEIGFKGFMKTFGTTFVIKINGISTIQQYDSFVELPKDSRLGWAASCIDEGFNMFVKCFSNQSDVICNQSEMKHLSEVLLRLLRQIIKSRHFDHHVAKMRHIFGEALSNFNPETFRDLSKDLLVPLKIGLSYFLEGIGKAYVNAYSGQTIDWDERNPETQYCAKAFLTTLRIFTELMDLNVSCMSSDLCKKPIFKSGENYPLAETLSGHGYDIPSSSEVQDGELRCGLTGMIIGTLLTKKQLFTYLGKHNGILQELYEYLHHYYRVRHLSTPYPGRHPSSVNEMLRWLCGLTYNSVYENLMLNGFGDLFDKPDNVNTADVDISIKTEDDESLPSYPKTITASNLRDELTAACHHAEILVIGIHGHGHANGVYACEFNTNQSNLLYPSNMNALICMLYDVLKHLHQQCYFLYQRCSYESGLGGWRDCWYGKDVGGSSWRCNSLQCPNQSAEQTAKQEHKQICNQECNQQYECGIKSPLQSFLEDGLKGFLPHTLDGKSGKLNCIVTNHVTIPCKTPMGFSDISQTASHRQTGEHLLSILEGFCGSDDAALTKLCSHINCLLSIAPKTLSDMFGFYYHFLYEWSDLHQSRRQHRKDAFDDAITKANFGVKYDGLNITTIFTSHRHHEAHSTGDLFSLVRCKYDPKYTSAHHCGPYLRPLCYDIYANFSEKHGGQYLSWIVYLTETFYKLLRVLYDECCKKCNTPGSKCYRKVCVRNCSTLQDLALARESKHDAACTSIVQCPATIPTLYRYGFALKSPSTLHGAYNDHEKRTCQDLRAALENVLQVGNALHTLAFVTIPKFLFDLRQPFIWLNVALWLLSLLYLLHIMVIRLDLLHIKSHLHSPSSHRIAAQSLLAAARVNKLNRVFYLQP